MPKIKFTRAYEVKDGTGTKYEVGQEIEVNDASAKHFVNRSAAEIVQQDTPKRGRPKKDNA